MASGKKSEKDRRKNRRSPWAVVSSIIFNTLPGYRWLFINSNPQVLPIHTNSARAAPRPVRTLMDAAPLRGSAPVQEPGGKGNTRTWLVPILGRQGMIRNVRPDREIQHTSNGPPRSSSPFFVFSRR